MKKLIFFLVGLMLSASFLCAQEIPPSKVYLATIDKGTDRFLAEQRYIPERSAYQVVVHALLVNATSRAKKATVTVKVRDARGKVVNGRKETVKVPAATGYEYNTFVPIDKPQIWNGSGTPYRYKVSVSVGKFTSESDFIFRSH